MKKINPPRILKQTLTEQMAYALSGDDIQKLVPFRVKVYRYSDIKDFDNIDQLLQPYGSVIILFETSVTKHNQFMGHWCCLCKTYDEDNNESINFFDSYGIIPDDEKKKIDKEFMQLIGTTDNYLSKLLWESKNKCDMTIEYNEKKLQKMAKNINTCGRWCAVRLILKELSLRDFQAFMERLKLQYKRPGDEIVTILTQPILDDEMTSSELYKSLSDLFFDN